MKRLPRPAGVLVVTLGAVTLHAVVPFELSRLGDRAGRPARRSPVLRSAGLVTVAAGAGMMAWALAAHGEAAPRGWALFYGRPAIWAGLAIECAAFAGIVRWEERRLLGRFGGDYRAYLADVPRWVPRSEPPGRPAAGA